MSMNNKAKNYIEGTGGGTILSHNGALASVAADGDLCIYTQDDFEIIGE